VGYYEAQMSFTHPGVSRRFTLHRVYDLDDDVVELLGPAIAKGRLRPLTPHEVEDLTGAMRVDRPVGGQASATDDDEDSPAQDPGGQGDDAGRQGEAPTPPGNTRKASTASSPATPSATE
jgi:hypothetical protein